MPTWCARGRGHAVAVQAAVSVVGRLLASPAIISEKNTPIDSAVPEFWKVERMPDATPRWLGGDAAHDRRTSWARANMPLPIPFSGDQHREGPVREVDRQQHQPDEAAAEHAHAGGGKAARAEAVGQRARHGAGDEEAGGQRQQEDAGPQRRVARSCSRARAARSPAAR